MTTKERKDKCLEKYTIKNIIDNNLPFDDYVFECFFKCNPQSYGPKIEKRIIKEHNLGSIKKSESRGDFYVKENSITSTTFKNILKPNDTCEIKVSFLSGLGNSASFNFIQLRPYEKFDYYLFVTIDFDLIKRDVIIEWYLLRKDVIHSEFNINLIHGGKESNKENKNKLYKLHVVKNSEQHKKLKELNLI